MTEEERAKRIAYVFGDAPTVSQPGPDGGEIITLANPDDREHLPSPSLYFTAEQVS